MPKHSHTTPELLAPAGGREALRAAIAGGADAVYLGVDRLNARRGAENFTLESLPDACRYAHLRGVRTYLTANVVILPDELGDALQLVDEAWAAGVDAVIVQDLGLLRAVRESLPHVRVHASTQLNTHSPDTLVVLAERGASRITLARETSLTEITNLAAKAAEHGAEVESFVHGALCVCYSGQCLFSSLVGQRSANRGMCAQPCRLTYELLDERGRVVAAPGAHLLSPRDLAGITVLPELVSTGVAALKIEGRMKSPEYVALVTGVYRAALDRALASPDSFEVRDGEMSVLSEAFSRGFTEAYLTGERGNDMMSYRRPNNRGVLVGRIASSEMRVATVPLEISLDTGDTIEVWTSRGRFAQTVGEMRSGGKSVPTAAAGTRVTIVLEEPASAGDRVFRVRNSALAAAARRTFSDVEAAPLVPLLFAVRLVIGEPARVEVRDTAGRTGFAEGPIVERARTKEITAEDVAAHVGRLGGTPYEAVSWEIDLSAGAGMSFSALHAVRRAALEAYEVEALSQWNQRERVHPHLPSLPKRSARAHEPRLAAAASSLSAARACFEAGAVEVHVPVWALEDAEPMPGVVPVLPRVDHAGEIDRHLAACEGYPTVVAGTLGALARARAAGFEVQAHWGLNATNAHTVAELADIGAGFVWLSPELSGRQIAAVAAQAVTPVGIAIAGRQEVMVTEHCVLMSEGPCSQRCATCKRRQSSRALRDRKGYELPLVTDPTGRTHLFNAVPLDLTAALDEVLASGVTAVRVDLEAEGIQRSAVEVARIRRALSAAIRGREPEKPAGPTTSGHFFRGVK